MSYMKGRIITLALLCVALLLPFSRLIADDRASGYAIYGPIRINTILPPVFSIPEGEYAGPQTISLLSGAGPNARIRYTLDGSNPTMNSGILYTAPITINQTTVVKSRVYLNNVYGSESPVETKTYFISQSSVPYLTFTIENAAGADTVATVELVFEAGEPISKPTTTNAAVFTNLDLNGRLTNNAKVMRINLKSGGGSLIGHMKFEYTKSDYQNALKYALQLFVHDEHIPFSPESGGTWEYYSSAGERMVSMLVQPPSLSPQRNPMLLVHGVGGAFPAFGRMFIKQLNKNPSTTADDTNDIWEFYYPYDQQIELSAPLLGNAIQFVRQLYPGNPNPQRVSVIAHSMGGLVTRNYIQECQGNDTGIGKFLMLGTPNHGSHSSFRISNTWYYPVSSLQNEFIIDIDENSPAVRQMYPGSPFLMQLNSIAPNHLYPGSNNQNTYLVLAGTQNEFRLAPDYVAGWEHYAPASNDDIVVSTASASLLEWGIPLATVNYDHMEINGTKPVNIPLVFNVMDPEFLSTFFTYDYSASGNPFGSPVDNFWLSPQNSDDRPALINVRFNKNLNSEMIGVRKTWLGNTLKLTFKSAEDIEEDSVTEDDRQYLGASNRLRKSGVSNNQSHYFMEQKTSHVEALIIPPYLTPVFPRFGQTANITPGIYDLKFYNYYGQLVKTIPNGINITGLTTSGVNIDLTNAEAACIQLNNTNNPNQTRRMRDGLNRNYIEKQFYVDSTINATVFYIGDEDVIAGFENHNAHLIDPMNTVIDPVTAVGMSNVEYIEDITSGYAYYYVENPMQGTWLLRYNDSLSEALSSSLVDSPLSISINFPEGILSAGDIVPFTLPLPQDQNYSTPFFSVALTFTDSTSVIHDLGQVPVEQNLEQNHYTGSFTATAPGQYKLAVSFACLSEGQMVQRYSERSIHVQNAVPPSLQYPQNNGLNLPTALILKWNAVANANSFQVSVYRQEDNSHLVSMVVADTLLALQNLDYGTEYHWYVSSISNYGSSMMSEVYTFVTTQAPPQPSYPEHGAANVPQAVTITWEAVLGASLYGLQLASEADFTDCWINTYDITGTSFGLTGLSPQETYYWRICAVGDGGYGEWSAIRSFTVRQTAIEFPGAVTLSENTYQVLYLQNHIDDYDPGLYQVTVENDIHLQIGMFADRIVITPQDQWYGTEQLLIKVFSLPRFGYGGMRQRERTEDEPIYQTTLDVTVTAVNDLPILSIGTELMFWNTEDWSIDLSPYLSDADDILDNILVSTVSGTDVSVSVAGHVLTFTAPYGWYGTDLVEVGIGNPAPAPGNRSAGRTWSNCYYIMVSLVDATPALTGSHDLEGNIKLCWAGIPGAEGYHVYGSGSPMGTSIDITDSGSLWQQSDDVYWLRQTASFQGFFYVKAFRNERGIINRSLPLQPILPDKTGKGRSQ